MPAVIESLKTNSKQEEFVEKQIESVRSRIRTLDFFSAGLVLLIGSLAFVFAVLMIDRYVETPKGAGWAIAGIYLLCAAGYVYLSLFRPSRRKINPYFAARKVEQTITDAKNSVINYVDLKDDDKVPASVKTAIGVKAAKDLKHVDLNQATEQRQLLWLASVAGFFLVAALIAVFLPPTRTTLSLLTPEEGNTYVIQGDDFRLEVRLEGRIPGKGAADVARARIWYNSEDPNTFEERLLEPVDNQKKVLGLTIPAKQIRNGFFYKVLAGNAQTPDYEVKLRIIPQFTGWEVVYKFADYLKKPPLKDVSPNLAADFGTEVTVTAFTNRPVRSGLIEIFGDGNAGLQSTVPGQLVDGNDEAIRFQFPMLRNGSYKIRFVTTEGDKNRDPQLFRIGLLNPKPMFQSYDLSFEYPKYRRWTPETRTMAEPNIETVFGAKVVIVGHANRPVKEAKLHLQGVDQPIAGEILPDQPMLARFTLPTLKKDGAYRVWFAPKTEEGPSDARKFDIRIIADEPPQVSIIKPEQLEVEVPANGVLSIEGKATDDVGIDRMNLLIGIKLDNQLIPLKAKPYRGKEYSFRRESDGSYPDNVDYKDFVDLAKVEKEGDPNFKLVEGMVIEYKLEAIDNFFVPPDPMFPAGDNNPPLGPNHGYSEPKRIKIVAPLNAQQQKERDKQKQKLEQEKRQHDQKQDQKNANEKRDNKQPQQQGEQRQQQGAGEKKEENAEKQDPKENAEKQDPKNGMQEQGKPMPGDQPPPRNAEQQKEDENLKKEEDKVRDALQRAGKDDMPPEPKNPGEGQKQDAPMPKDAPKGGQPQDAPRPMPGDPKGGQPQDAPKPMPGDPKGPQPQDAPKPMPGDPKGAQPPDAPKPMPGDPKGGQEQRDPMKNPDPKGGQPMPNMGGGSDMNTDPKNLPNPEDFQKLAEQLESKDPKEREQAREQLKKMMEQSQKNPPKPEEQKKKLDDQRKNLDQQGKEKFDKAMEKLQDEMKDIDRDEKVDRAAEKAKSDNPKEREEGQQELERLMENKQDREKVEEELQRLEGKETNKERKQRLDDAERLARDNLKKKDNAQKTPMPPRPKEEEEDVDKLAKKKKEGTPQEQKEAQEKIEKMLQDPMKREQTEKQLKDFRDNLKTDEEKKDFDKSMRQMRDNVQKKQGGGDNNNQPKLNPDDVAKFAKQLQSDNKEERRQAQKQLEEALKKTEDDPKASQEAQDQIQKMRDNIKDENKKQEFDKAVGEIEKSVQKHRQEQAQQRKEAAEKIANDLNSKDADKQQAAQKKLEKMMQDPKTKEQVKNELDKIKQGAGDQQTKDNIDKAVEQAEKNIAEKKQGGGSNDKVKPEDVRKLADDLNSKDAGKQQAAQKKLEEMLQDPKTKEQVKNELDKIKQGAGDQQTKDNIDKVEQQAEKNVAKKDGAGAVKPDDKEAKDKAAKKGGAPKLDSKEAQKLARQLRSKDPKQNQAAREQIEEMAREAAKDPESRKEFQKQLAEMMKDPDLRKDVEEASANAQKTEIQKLAEQLANGKPDEKQKAKEKLEKAMKHPIDREVAKMRLEEQLEKIEDQKARAEFEKQIKDIAKDLDRKDADNAKGADLTKHDGKKPGGNTREPEQTGPIAELKNKAKASELLLEKYKRNISNEEFRKQLGWTEEQMAAFMKKYAQQVEKLKADLAQAEAGKLPRPRSAGHSALDQKAQKIEMEPKEGGNALQGGKFIAPPGFGDSYKRFTEEASGVRSSPPKK